MTTASPVSTRRIPLRSITICQGEGEIDKLLTGGFPTWAEAEELIQRICARAPAKGGYYKTDFTIVWLDGETYKGRYDAAHPTAKAYEGTLAQHVRHHLEFCAGLSRPDHLPEEDYNKFLDRMEKDHPGAKADAFRVLTTYAMCDDTQPAPQPQRVTPTVPPAQVATINPPTTMEGSSPSNPTTPTTGDSAMTTATSTPTQPVMSAKEAHEHHTKINAGKPLVAVTGDTFPVKGVLYAWGGKWNKDTKTWDVPAHKHAEAQQMLDDRAAAKAKPVAKAPATVQSTPAPATPVKAAPKADLKQPKPVSGSKAKPTSLESRIEFLLRGAEHILIDAKGTSAEAALQGAIALMKGLVK
jgi:hypothetical protein